MLCLVINKAIFCQSRGNQREQAINRWKLSWKSWYKVLTTWLVLIAIWKSNLLSVFNKTCSFILLVSSKKSTSKKKKCLYILTLIILDIVIQMTETPRCVCHLSQSLQNQTILISICQTNKLSKRRFFFVKKNCK